MEINENGAVIYRGPSMLDGQPIVAIVTGLSEGSANAKTGAMLQTWIMRSDVKPGEALKTGADSSVCGDCPLRPFHAAKGAAKCYVNVGQAPRGIWECFNRGGYRDVSPDELAELSRGKVVRLGSYGDPAAVPVAIWQAYKRHATGSTGYTHQWKNLDAAIWAPLVMASADTANDGLRATLRGFRYFRVRELNDAVIEGEIICPASMEGGYKTTCADCKLCMGTSSKARVSIAIANHGPGSETRRKSAAATKAAKSQAAA